MVENTVRSRETRETVTFYSGTWRDDQQPTGHTSVTYTNTRDVVSNVRHREKPARLFLPSPQTTTTWFIPKKMLRAKVGETTDPDGSVHSLYSETLQSLDSVAISPGWWRGHFTDYLPEEVGSPEGRNRLRSAIRELDTADLNLGMMCAEYKETAEMFSDFANKLWLTAQTVNPRISSKERKRAQQKLKRQAKGDGRSASDNAAKAHLTYSFGISPVISDGNAVADQINSGFVLRDTDDLIVPVRVIESKVTNNSVQYFPLSVTTERTVLKERYMASVIYKQGLAAELARFGLFNPLSIAYDAIPLSFVLDWAINMGDYLASLDSSVMVESVTYAVRRHQTTTHELQPRNHYGSGQTVFAKATWSVRSVTRPLDMTVELVSRVPSGSAFQIITSVALLRKLSRNGWVQGAVFPF